MLACADPGVYGPNSPVPRRYSRYCTGRCRQFSSRKPSALVRPACLCKRALLGSLIMGQDVRADAIVKKAQDSKVSLSDRAIEAVKSIVRQYYDESMLSEVTYDEKEPGLSTTPVGKGKDIKGKITVGKYFIEHIDAFARRVLQVGHELQHVKQEREGMAGKKNQDKREFLAFSWEGFEPEKSGTGRLPDATRRDLIDAALGYFNCLPADDQKALATKQAELLKRREGVNGTHGNASTEPPKDCRRQLR
jgi:hypothetical protein